MFFKTRKRVAALEERVNALSFELDTVRESIVDSLAIQNRHVDIQLTEAARTIARYRDAFVDERIGVPAGTVARLESRIAGLVEEINAIRGTFR